MIRNDRHRRRSRILSLGAVLIIPAVSWVTLRVGTAEAKPTGKPNILFILTDDQRWDALGCYGNDIVKTPNFDRLAREGARLDGFYVASPLCCSSRATFLSGLYPHQNGVTNNQMMPDLKPNTPTVATYLNTAGYITGFVGKAHMGGDPRRWDFRECPVWLELGRSPHTDPFLTVNGENQKVPGQITEIFTDAALQFLEKHKQDRWFLWFATTAPHTPYIMEQRYSPQEVKPPPGWPANEPLERPGRLAGFYATVSMLDEQVGRVLQKLDELGLAQNTFVFMASDNGIMFGSHGERAKGTWFEGSARVPALARWPGKIKPGTKTASPMDSVDFLPTVLDAAGIRRQLPKIYQCKSMMPALTGGKPLRKIAYSELEIIPMFGGDYWQMARDQRWKYVRFKKSGEEHLYDLKKDPSELEDLAAAPEHAEVLREMREKLTAWVKATPPQTAVKSSGARPGTRSAARVCYSH